MSTDLTLFESPEEVVDILVDSDLWTPQLDPTEWDTHTFADGLTRDELLSELLDHESEFVLEMADLYFTDVAEFLNTVQDMVSFDFDDDTGTMTAETEDGETIEAHYEVPDQTITDEEELLLFAAQLEAAAPVFRDHCTLDLWLTPHARAVFAADPDVVASLRDAVGKGE